MKAKILTILGLIGILISCVNSDENSISPKIDEFKSAGVESSKTITASSKEVTSFLNSDFYANLNSNWQIEHAEAQLISLSTKEYSLVSFKIKGSSSLLIGVFNNKNNSFEHAYVQDYSKNAGLETMTQYYIDGTKRISVEARDGKVGNFRKYNDKPLSINARTQLAGSFDKCMDLAVNACSSDWQCAILCGLAFWQCAAATAIACYATQ